ncbi:MAG TPA: MFS transporter, partial [Anaerolineaceae bacterium]|nr:MFS transporter [Anaerolineaceae bacterium]
GHGRRAEAQKALRMVDPEATLLSGAESLAAQQSREAAAAPAAHPGLRPWSRPFRGRTLSLWFMWIAFNFMFQGMFVWLPSVLIAAGHSPERASLLALVINLGQIPGTLAAAALADAISRRTTVMGFLALLGVACVFFGLAHGAFAVVFWGFVVAIGLGALWGMAYPFTTELYPTEIRGAATGWSTGIGRMGGIFSPLLVGAMLTAGASNAAIYSALAVMPFVTIAVLLGVRQETTRRTLEEID